MKVWEFMLKKFTSAHKADWLLGAKTSIGTTSGEAGTVLLKYILLVVVSHDTAVAVRSSRLCQSVGRGRGGRRLAIAIMSPKTPAAVTSAPAPGPRTTNGCAL